MFTSPANRSKIAQKVTLIGMMLDLALGILKLLIGSLANSHALIADAIHSFSDAFTDIFVLFVNHFSNHAPDIRHPYGHARFETMGTLILGSTLIAIGLMLSYTYVGLMFTEKPASLPSWPALLVALISIISKEWIYRYTKKAGEKLRSNLLIANAWHSRTDAFSSVIVLIGVTGGMAGLHWLDIIAALLVALIVLKIGSTLVWDSIKELVDTGAEPAQINKLRTTLLSINGVLNVHDLRTRRMGQDVLLDVHLQVEPTISVSEGHQIGEWATRELLRQHNYISDVIYHIDAENNHAHELQDNNPLLPLRHEVIASLEQYWQSLPISHITLHYLGNQVDVILCLSEGYTEDKTVASIKQQLLSQKQQLPWLGNVSIWRETAHY